MGDRKEKEARGVGRYGGGMEVFGGGGKGCGITDVVTGGVMTAITGHTGTEEGVKGVGMRCGKTGTETGAVVMDEEEIIGTTGREKGTEGGGIGGGREGGSTEGGLIGGYGDCGRIDIRISYDDGIGGKDGLAKRDGEFATEYGKIILDGE